MPTHYYLPRLRDQHDVPAPDQEGHWKDREHRLLQSISAGIAVDQHAVDVRGVSSIPDVWARPLMFQAAIRPGSGHPLRRQILAEWRGLLSLLALRKIYHYPVSIAPVPLVKGSFESALTRLAPRPEILHDDTAYQWTDILLIRYGDVPIGAFSPTTLVYTAVDYHTKQTALPEMLQQRGPDGVPNGRLAPPSPEHPDGLAYVGTWVRHLKARLSEIFAFDESHPGHRATGMIQSLLSDWIEEMSAEETPLVKVGEATRDESLTAWSPLSNYSVYRELLRPLESDWEQVAAQGGSRSELALDAAPRRGRFKNAKTVVVVTERLLLQNLRIWDDWRLGYLGERPDAAAALTEHFDAPWGTHIGGTNLQPAKAVWIRPERFFLSDVLLKTAGGGSSLPEAERALNGGGHFLLPLRREILDFFTPEEVRETLNPQFREVAGGIAFSIELPVHGQTERIEKIYRSTSPGANDGTLREVTVPVLDLFPDYLGSTWRRYYLFQADPDRLRFAPVVPEGVETTSREHSADVQGVRRQARITEVRGDDPFPEGVEVLNAAADEALGLILIGRPLLEQSGLSNKWVVGIDFGTSNTNVFRQSSASDIAERWTFDFPKYLRPLTRTHGPERDAMLSTFFIPNKAVDLPVPTALRIFHDARREHLLLDYFVYFGANYALPPNVRTNIKWDEDQQSRRTENFLQSLFFLLLMEAVQQRVREVEVRCSYPKAFSSATLNMFQAEWTTAFDSLVSAEESGRVLDPRVIPSDHDKLQVSEPAYELEGVAAGYFFGDPRTIHDASERFQPATPSLCMDVGGATTDISIWNDDAIVLDASVLLAGRQVADFLRRRPRLRELLFSTDAAVALKPVENQPEAFAARLNSILRQEESLIADKLVKSPTAETRRLRQIIMVEFGALAFYTAALLAAADRTPRGKKVIEKVTGGEIRLHWGGNAAKFITWIDSGRYDPKGNAAFFLNALLYHGLNDAGAAPSHLAQFQSPGHKSEAAGGLVVLPEWRLSRGHDEVPASQSYQLGGTDGAAMTDSAFALHPAAQDAAGVVVGEDVMVGGESLSFVDLLAEQDLFSGNRTRFEGTQLTRLERFLLLLNQFGVDRGLLSEGMKIQLTEQSRRHIARQVEGDFIRMQAKSPGSRLIEPIFIMEVRHLLDLMITSGR